MAARGFAEMRDPGLVGYGPLNDLFLGEPAGGDFRHGINAVGEELRRLVRRCADGMASSDSALFHRRRGKGREAHHVTGRIDSGDGGLEGLGVDLQPTAIVGFQPCGFQVQRIDCAHATGSE